MKYGFQDLFDRLEIPGKHLLQEKFLGEPIDCSTAERIRMATESLGPAFVKFGQVLSLRPDMVPMDIVSELRKLQSHVSPVPSTSIRRVVEKGLGKSIGEVFSEFDDTPLAAASLGQVHRAVLREGGNTVAVKVQRPDIRQQIEKDISILETLAAELYDRMEAAKLYNFPAIVETFKQAMDQELDFTNEQRNMIAARRNLSTLDWIVIPAVYPVACCETVLSMDLLVGQPLVESVSALSPQQRIDLSKKSLEASIKQMLDVGIFHADPHPGNVMVLSDQRLGLLDWGIVGYLSDEDRHEMVTLVESVIAGDAALILDSYLSLAQEPPVDFNERQAIRDIDVILKDYRNVSLGAISLGKVMMRTYTMLRRYQLQVPHDMVLMLNTLLKMEGTTRLLNPDINLVDEATPHVRQLMLKRWSPVHLLKRWRHTIYQVARLNRGLPRHLRTLLEKMEHGDFNVRFHHENLDGLRESVENSANRITVGVIISALIMGSSIIITTGVEPKILGYPAIGIVGYVLSAVIGMWLIYSIFRSNKF